MAKIKKDKTYKRTIPLNTKTLDNKIDTYPYVEIEWLDIEGDAGWSDRGQFDRANVGSGHTADELDAIFSALDVDKNGVVTFGR